MIRQWLLLTCKQKRFEIQMVRSQVFVCINDVYKRHESAQKKKPKNHDNLKRKV